MIDIAAMILGMIGSALNMTLSYRLQMFGIGMWLAADILLIIYLWDISWWLVALNVFYVGTCTYGIYIRKKTLN
jgi:hypothetical protein